MLTITITTPLGDIEIQHSNKTAKALGNQRAVNFWNIDVQNGLFGVHGHIFDPEFCDIADVISAAIGSVGLSNVKVPEKSRLQAVKDLESYPDPKDSLP
jgi:hypothetical protein